MATNASLPADLATATPAARTQFPTAAREFTPHLLPSRTVYLHVTQGAWIDDDGLPSCVISYGGIASSNKTPTMPGWNFTLAFSLSDAGRHHQPFFIAIDDPVTKDEQGIWRFLSDEESCKFTVFTKSGTCHELKIECFSSRWVAIQPVR